MSTPLLAPAPSSSAVSGPSSPSARLLSLDVYRGLTIAGMILVTDPGTYSAVYPQLRHAEWTGATLTDMIFPSFLFIVGVAMTLSFAAALRRGASRGDILLRAVRRAASLTLLGLVLNAFPTFDLHTLRLPGILQRIAACYLLGTALFLFSCPAPSPAPRAFRAKQPTILTTIAFALLVLWWALLRFYPVPGFGPGRFDSLGNLAAVVDRAVFGVRHLWAYGTTPGYGVTYDPEGLLSTLGAITTLLAGLVAGLWLRSSHTDSRKAVTLAAVGVCLFALGLSLDPWLPINKRIYTSSFALLSTGFSLATFALFFFLVDIRRWRGWTTPALVFGSNAILAFAVSTVLTSLGYFLHVHARAGSSTRLNTWIFERGFAPWLSPIHASLAYAVAVVLLNLVLIYPLYRRRIFLRL